MNEENQTHTWDTEHDTANRTMTHNFGFGFKVLVDWKNMKLIQLKDGEVKSISNFRDENLSLSDYETLLLKTEKEVDRLKRFNNGNNN